MGCCYSKIERQEMVSRCKARKRYMRELVRARQSLSASHAMYVRSLRSAGSSLLHFSANETTLHHPPMIHGVQAPRPPPLAPRPPHLLPPLSPGSQSGWTSTTTSSALPPPPPPPPPPPISSTWDFWDPFVPPPPSSSEEEEWEEETATVTASDAARTVTAAGAATAPASEVSGFSKETGITSMATGSELAMVVSRHGKDLGIIMKEVDEYFLRAADAGGQLSCLLEVSSTIGSFGTQGKGGKLYDLGCNLAPSALWSWGASNAKLNCYGNLRQQVIGGNGMSSGVGSHSSTLERLYAWEKKLCQEVKNSETTKAKHEKKMAQVRKLEMKRADYMKTEKAKKEVEKLESLLMVSTQAIETTSAEIIKLRETELYPQLVELVKGLMCMWRSMYESHQVQTHIVQQLKYLNTIPSIEPTSEINKQATLQLELEVQHWHQSFCNLVKAQRDYVQSLTGWLRLSLFQFSKNPLVRSSHESRIYTFCEEWHLAIDRIPDKVASEGIKSLLTAVQGIVAQQADEHKQKKKAQSLLKSFESKAAELRTMENKYGPFSGSDSGNRNLVSEKRAKVDVLKIKAEEEKGKHEKAISVTRAMTLNNLQISLPHVFQAMVGFSSVCMQAFESVYNQGKSTDQHEMKRLMP